MSEELNVIISAHSAEEAIEEAVHSYEIPADELVAEPLDEEGDEESETRRYRVTRKPIVRTLDPTAARELLRGLLETMEIEAEIEDTLEDTYLHMEIQTEDSGLLIGKHGKTLESLQLMMNLMVQRRDPDCGLRIVLNTGGYRAKRSDQLTEMAQRAAQRARDTQEEQELAPMNPADRRIVHRILLEEEGITTFSRGLGDNRYVVIAAVDENGQPIPGRPRRRRPGGDRGHRDDRGGGRRGGGGGRSMGGRDRDRGHDRNRDRGRDRDRDRGRDRDSGPSALPGPVDDFTVLEGESLSGRLSQGDATPDEVFGDRPSGGEGHRGGGSHQGESRGGGGSQQRRGGSSQRRDRGGPPQRRDQGGSSSQRRGGGSQQRRGGPPQRRDRSGGGQSGGGRPPSYRLPDDEPLWASEGKDPDFD